MRAGLLTAIPPLREIAAIGIIRGCPLERVDTVAGAAMGAGLSVLEVTFDSEEPARQIEAVRRRHPGAVVGAGTVLDRDALLQAVDAGAAFVVTPVVEEELIRACVERNLPCLPGAATATEVWRAHVLGAAAVKVFPAEQLGGPAYVKALLAPLRSVELVPTGGVDADNAAAYLGAGAAAVGVGSSVFAPAAMAAGDVEAIGEAARAVVERVGGGSRG